MTAALLQEKRTEFMPMSTAKPETKQAEKPTEKPAEKPAIAGLVKVSDGYVTRFVKERDLKAMERLGYKKV